MMTNRRSDILTCQRPVSGGFTLVELMIVVALMGIMAAIAAPGFRDYMAQNRLNGAARLVMTDLMYARSQAATENANFTVDFSGNSYSVMRTDDSDVRRSRNIQDEYFDVTMTSNQDFVYRPNGTVTAAGTVTLTNSKGTKQVIVSMAGRVRIE
ncbi:MAG TPA: type II secretion system protein GspH [Deltaproteobacteria bacterium]|nr:type II secretion system protein GspH [Deltaproteobacteria bacterium]